MIADYVVWGCAEILPNSSRHNRLTGYPDFLAGKLKRIIQL